MEKNCGIYAIECYLSYLNIDSMEIVAELGMKLESKGIAIKTIKECLNNHHLTIQAYKGFKSVIRAPYIAYSIKQAHYMFIHRIGFMVEIEDQNGKYRIPCIFCCFLLQTIQLRIK